MATGSTSPQPGSWKGLSPPHRRYNPLRDEWVIVSSHRIARPWQGQTEATSEESNPGAANAAPDLSNPLVPGATRSNGAVNPNYESVFVFTNDFSALLDNSEPDPVSGEHPLFQSKPAIGTCKVMCFHPNSNLQLATMSEKDIAVVINAWITEFIALADKYEWVQVFENKGAIMGCSNSHPHGQIWACGFLPNYPAIMDRTQKAFFEANNSPMLLEYAKQEDGRKVRTVVENEDWLVVVHYWAVWPFETMLLPKRRQILRLSDLSASEIASLAQIMKQLLVRYDNLFKCSFPYSMGWYGAPTGKHMTEDMRHWQLHAVWLPPLLRSASVKKFMAGFELLCEPQRDLTPEKAAQLLREQSDVHYKKQPKKGKELTT